MQVSDFSDQAPGKFVPTEVSERHTRRERAVSATSATVVTGKAFVPNPLPPTLKDEVVFLGRLTTRLVAAVRDISLLEGRVQSLPDPSVLLQAMYLRDVQASSTIEATVATVREMLEVGAGERARRPEVLQVYNNLRAIEIAVESELPVCRRLMRDMHAALIKGTSDAATANPGEFRTSQVYIGEKSRGFAHARFVPPPAGQALESCLDEFENYCNRPSDPPGLHWLIDLALIHYQFEAIHPFVDGNGRVGRALIAVLPFKRQHTKFALTHVSEFIEHHRQRYYDLLLRVSTQGDWESWVQFILDAVSWQSRANLGRANDLISLRDHYRDEASLATNSANALTLIDHAFAEPILTTAGVAAALDVSSPTARSLLERLSKIGIVTEGTGGDYRRMYFAEGILDIIERPGTYYVPMNPAV